MGRKATGKFYNGCGVYRITCLVNKRVYFGSSVTVSNRIYNQKCRLRKNEPSCSLELLSDYKYYGEDNFVFEIIEKTDNREAALQIEQNYINSMKDSVLLYNKTNPVPPKIHRNKRFSGNEKYDREYFIIRIQPKYKKILKELAHKDKKAIGFYLECLIDEWVGKL